MWHNYASSLVAARPPDISVLCLSAGDCETQRRNENVSLLISGPLSGKRPPPPSRSCQGGSAVCFPPRREDTLNKSDGSVYFLHVEGRGETQDWFYPLPGSGKVSRRPLCRGKGTIEILCDEMCTDGDSKRKKASKSAHQTCRKSVCSGA